MSCVSSSFVGDASYRSNVLGAHKNTYCGTLVMPTMGLVPISALGGLITLTHRKTAMMFIRRCPRSIPKCTSLGRGQRRLFTLLRRLPKRGSFQNARTFGFKGKHVVIKDSCRRALRHAKIPTRRLGAH